MTNITNNDLRRLAERGEIAAMEATMSDYLARCKSGVGDYSDQVQLAKERDRLLKELSYLTKALYRASGFCTIRQCRSCLDPYPVGYVCYCGKDNSITDDEASEEGGG